MARVQFLNGILSGKLGGTVYAHNKAGYYVRQYSLPTNPNTIAQADARNEFAAAVTSWHLLSDQQKTFWNTYATGDFRGKDDDPTVLYSGFNAFVSLWNATKNAHRKTRTYTMKGNGTNALTYDEVEFSPQKSPPTGIYSANIQDYQSNPLGMSFDVCAIARNGKARWHLSFFASPGPQTDAPIFIEPVTSLPVGLVLYVSNVIAQKIHFVTKPNQTILGVCKPPDSIAGWVPDDEYIEYNFEAADPTMDDHKLWFDTGDIVRAELWSVGSEGPIIRIGELIVTVIDDLG